MIHNYIYTQHRYIQQACSPCIILLYIQNNIAFTRELIRVVCSLRLAVNHQGQITVKDL